MKTAQKTLGQLISESMDRNLVRSLPGIPTDHVEKLKTDSIYPNNIPICLFRNMIRLLAIDIEQAESAMYATFEMLDQAKQIKRKEAKSIFNINWTADLWENKESLGKYITRLKELLLMV